MSRYLDPKKIRSLAHQIGLRPTKTRGQNFVTDANTVRRIVANSQVGKDDVVLEIGPGLGSLTLGLLDAGAEVIAVEIEESLANLLPQTVAEIQPDNLERLKVMCANALDLTSLPAPQPNAVVANLPYNVSVPVLLSLWQHFDSLKHGLVMVQLEVAERLAAMPGAKNYGVPSAKLAWWVRATKVGAVGSKVFWPVPNVDSALVRLERQDPPETKATREEVFQVIDLAFSQRRKMLRGLLANQFGGGQAVSAALKRVGIPDTARGETLDLATFARLAEELGR